MWPFLFLLAAMAAAFLHFQKRFSGIEAAGLGAATGTLLYAWAGIAAYWLWQDVQTGFGFANLASSAALGAMLWREKPRLEKIPSAIRNMVTEHRTFLIFLATFCILFGGLLFTHTLQQKPDGLYSGGNTWADLAFHLTVATHFLYANPFPPAYSIIQAPLGYPFAADFLAAMLAHGTGLAAAMAVPSWLAAIAFTVLMYAVGRKTGLGQTAAVAAILILLLNGGFGFLDLPSDAAQRGLLEALSGRDYAVVDPGSWTNTLNSLFLPQRSLLFGAAVFAGIVLLLLSAKRKRDYLEAGILTGLLPFLHWHSFLVLMAVTAAWAFLYREKKYAAFFAPAIALAIPQAIWSLGQLAGTGFIRFSPNWQANTLDVAAAAGFWLMQTGIWIPLAAVALWNASAEQRKRSLPFAVIFLVASFVVFQPFAYDNIKFFFYVQWMAALLIAGALAALWKKPVAFKLLAALLFLSLTFSGALSVARETGLSWRMYDNADLSLAEWAKTTPKEAVFLTSTRHNHPVSSLSGRRIVLGYPGWLWTHGIDYGPTETDVRAMFAGDQERMDRYGVAYAVIDAQARKDYAVNETFWSQKKQAYANPGFAVYDASYSRTANAANASQRAITAPNANNTAPYRSG